TQSKPVIAVEEHFVIEELDSFKDEDPNGPHAKAVAPIMNRLKNLGDNRIAEMDEAGVAKQIVSLTAPGTQQLERDEAIQLST
ncbi:amidohydrolase, partial [Staphylococcus epidermidis]